MPHHHAETVVDEMRQAGQARAAANAEMMPCQTEGGVGLPAPQSMQHVNAGMGCKHDRMTGGGRTK